MGPDLPSRPKFSWDIKNAPWTDAKGAQEKYYKSVLLWKSFHDKLPETNSNKIPSELQGIILKSQLFGRAVHLIEKVPDDEITAVDGAMAVAKCIYKCDPLSVVMDTFAKFNGLLQTIRGSNESFVNYESRFEAAVCRNQGATSSLPESLVGFIMITNARLEDTQRVSVLSAVAPKSDVEETSHENVSVLLNKIKYEDSASIIRSFDKVQSHASTSHPANSFTLAANSSHYRPPPHYRAPRTPNGKLRYRRSPEQLASLKKVSTCKSCKQKGHWAGDKECNNSNNDVTQDLERRIEPKPNRGSTGTVTFHMVSLSNNHDTEISSSICQHAYHGEKIQLGPLIDDGAPYSGMGLEEFLELKDTIMPSFDGMLDPLPATVAYRPFWQYGSGNHASSRRKILGSQLLSLLSDQGVKMKIRHLIIEGSSPWIIGRNVTRHTDIIHRKGNFLQFSLPQSNDTNTLQLIDHDFHSYLPRHKFYNDEYVSVHDPHSTAICSLSGSAHVSWSEKKKNIQ